MFSFMKSKKGFTLVELMIVVVIMAILVAVAVPIFSAVTKKTREKTCAGNKRQIISQISNLAMSDASAVIDGSEVYIVTDAKAETAYLSKAEPTEILSADVEGADTAITADNIRNHFQKFPFCPVAGNYYKVEVDMDETKSTSDSGSASVIVTCYSLVSDEAHG